MKKTNEQLLAEMTQLRTDGVKLSFRIGSTQEIVWQNSDNADKLKGLNNLRGKALHIIKRATEQVNMVKQVAGIAPEVVNEPVDMTAHIPQHNGYISQRMLGTTDAKLMQAMYEQKDFVLIIGETGCGKTHLVRDTAFKNKIPYKRLNLTGSSTPDDLVGQWVPNNNPEINTKYIWADGWLTKFMRNGGLLVLDEANMATADVLSVLHSVTDDEQTLVITQKDGEVVTAHPNFWLVLTMNPDYEGTKPLNVALKDRFRTLVLGYNTTVEKKLGVTSELADMAQKLRVSDKIYTPVSTRDLLKYIVDCVNYSEKVAKAFFVNNFEPDEQPVVDTMVELMVTQQNPEDNTPQEDN